MPEMGYSDAVDLAVAEAMAEDRRVLVFGEDVPLLRRDLAVRFGPDRVRGTPISESAFVGCGVGAAALCLGWRVPQVQLYGVELQPDYAALAVEWLGHLSHLKESYPYLFSLALRRNPLDPSARVEIPE